MGGFAASMDARSRIFGEGESMPIPLQFKSMSELIDYLAEVERRMDHLESENAALRSQLETVDTRSLDVIAFVKENWPKTGLVSKSWWIRALSVYGYYFVIQLIVGLILFILYLVIIGPIIAAALRQLAPGLR
jgi:hypothetical protein